MLDSDPCTGTKSRHQHVTETTQHSMSGNSSSQCPTLLDQAATSTTTVTDIDLISGAATEEEGEHWVQLSRDLRYILINCCSGPAATLCGSQSHRERGASATSPNSSNQPLTRTTLRSRLQSGSLKLDATSVTTEPLSQTTAATPSAASRSSHKKSDLRPTILEYH